MRRIQFATILILLGCCTRLLPLRAQTADVAGPPGRFLFIVETSKAMKREMPDAIRSVRELLVSGLDGQLRPGDTVGVWTFDSDMHAGFFPLQIWSGQNRQVISQMAAEFLREQKLAGKARPDQFVPSMLKLFKASDELTVLIYSTGEQPIEGTPFDDTINGVLKQHLDELTGAHIPFVTVLVGRKGRLVKCAINSATGVSLPAVPEETPVPPSPVKSVGTTPYTTTPYIKAAPFSTQTPLARTPVAKTNPNPSLIVDYSQSKPSQTGAGLASNAVAGPPSVTVVSGQTASNPAEGVRIIEAPAPPTNFPPAPAEAVGNPAGENILPAPAAKPVEMPTAIFQHAPVAPPPVAITNPPVASLAASANSGRSSAVIWLLVVLGLALVVIIILARRVMLGSPTKSSGSLITKSFDRDRK